MSLNYSQLDEALVEKARMKLRKMLFLRCFMSRWTVVQAETVWILNGRPNEKHHKKLLPDYCYNILELQRRTIYKAFSPLSEVLTIKDRRRAKRAKTIAASKKAMDIKWEKMGAVFALGESCHHFFEHDLENDLRKANLLKPKKKQSLELFQMIFGKDWIDKKLEEIQNSAPGKPLEKIIEDRLSQAEKIVDAIPEWHKQARGWSRDAVTEYHAGIVRGSKGFIDSKGQLVGEKKLKLRNTYEMLLLSWPEIDEMIKARPQKTRNHLWDWLKHFGYAGWIEITDLEQLNRLCNEIKLRLKKPGAPFKTK